jgi:hypothetical protein
MENNKNKNLSILKNLHSEEDVKVKVVMPYLKKLGYKEGKVMIESDVFSSVCKECHDKEIKIL